MIPDARAMKPDRTADARSGRMRSGRAPALFLAAFRAAGRSWTGGRLVLVHPDGRREHLSGPDGPEVELQVRDWAFSRRVLAAGDIGFAEGYIAGEWDTPDLAALLTSMALNYERLSGLTTGTALLRWLNGLRRLFHRNSPAQARRNIHAHYDLGNGFYAAWLDPSMTYSSALFERGGQTLEQAQQNKYAALCDAVGLEPGQSVLEIGCGWGGFAEYATRLRDAHVTGLTISRAQLEYARERMRRQALEDRADLRFEDYRATRGVFDRIVSIEMFEAVGEAYWPDYFRTLRERMKPEGRAGLQIITIADDLFDRYRRKVDFIQHHIFPGGMLISEGRLHEEAARAGLRVASTRRFGADYARTLFEWGRRFDAAWDDLRGAGFDEGFRRLWRFYLAYCEAGFHTGRTNVIQVVLEPS